MESKKDATPSKKRVLLTLPVELVDYLTVVTEQTGMNKSGYIGVLLRNQMLHEREDRAGDEEKYAEKKTRSRQANESFFPT